MNIIYAYWYVFSEEERTTNIISRNPENLEKFHDLYISNPKCSYHQYKHLIEKKNIDIISVFVYKDKQLLPVSNEILENGDFYSSYDTTSQVCEEILVYLSKEDYTDWIKCKNGPITEKEDKYPSFFYQETISHSPILFDFYYEEGIMNA